MSAAPTATAPKPAVGRPCNSALDDEILQAVRDLLVERGYHDLSIQEVTRRCGIHVRTIARRWNTKAELVAASILGGDAPRPNPAIAATGRLADDIRTLVDLSLRFLADPATMAAYPALLAEMHTNADVRRQFRQRTDEWAATIRSVLEHAVESGDAPARVITRGRLLPNILGGTAFNLQSSAALVDDELVDELTDFVLASLLAGETA